MSEELRSECPGRKEVEITEETLVSEGLWTLLVGRPRPVSLFPGLPLPLSLPELKTETTFLFGVRRGRGKSNTLKIWSLVFRDRERFG